DSPITDRATPTTKNAAIPNSARASAVALDTDMKDNNAVVDRTTRTCRLVVPGRLTDFIKSPFSSFQIRAHRSNVRQVRKRSSGYPCLHWLFRMRQHAPHGPAYCMQPYWPGIGRTQTQDSGCGA